jgi:hypothetical protein
MKTKTTPGRRRSSAYALLIVLGVTAVAALTLAATINRTSTVASLNERNNQYIVNLNAAEAAVEKVYGRMAYDFQAFGLGAVETNLALYRVAVPTTNESTFWKNFSFSDGKGNVGRTYVNFISNYSGALPSQYPGLTCIPSPVYRVLSNAKSQGTYAQSTTAVQEDVLLGLVPITTYAIFYNELLEFSTCATMEVNGRVHANSPIYVGAGSSATLTFNGAVTTSSTLSAPYNNGASWGSAWRTTFNADPDYKTNVPSVTISLPMTNTIALIQMPPAGEVPNSTVGKERMYNKAQVVVLVSNTTITTMIRSSVSGLVPGSDPSPLTVTTNFSAALANFPFLNISNKFMDQREVGKTNAVTQVDLGKYSAWLKTNAAVLSKFPSGSGTYPTILYVADNRTTNSKLLTAVRVTNGIAPPSNGGLGFTLATPNPLYVFGNYNCTNSSHLGTTNTTSSVPSALMSDALTILSTNWTDSQSFSAYSGSSTTWDAAGKTTVNAAILTGIVPSTGTANTAFSGGVHNITRLLEDWSKSQLWLNTSIVCLFHSKKATGKFVNPGTYYSPPERHFSFDPNFLNPARQPPGIPCALVPIRFNWAVPPPNTVTYNVP